MIKVLEVFGEPLANGGQESFIMNMYRNVDRQKVQFNFFSPFGCQNEGLRNEIDSLGGDVFVDDKVFGESNNKNFSSSFIKFLKDHHYDIVHIHSGSTYALMMGAKIAHDLGVKTIIVHSHCGGFVNLKYHVIKFISTPFFLKYPTHYFACSHLAARWKFPKKIIQQQKYTVIKNAIDLSNFKYDENVRAEYRTNLGLEDKLVFGHVGRFATQKNHEFLIDIFQQIKAQEQNAVLLLVGVGELQESIIKKVERLGLEKDVQFLNLRKDVSSLLNAFDAFLLPSFFEGLPVVGVEAQATGLPVFTSDGVTPELPIPELSSYYSLDLPAEQWAKKILEKTKGHHRVDTRDLIIQSGYEIKSAAKELEDFYLSCSKVGNK